MCVCVCVCISYCLPPPWLLLAFSQCWYKYCACSVSLVIMPPWFVAGMHSLSVGINIVLVQFLLGLCLHGCCWHSLSLGINIVLVRFLLGLCLHSTLPPPCHSLNARQYVAPCHSLNARQYVAPCRSLNAVYLLIVI